jgi:glycosyltransferase involved in cell wall biosynthesis
MRRELISIEPSARVTAIYNGLDPEPFATCETDGTLQARLGLPTDYLLAVGHLEPRKNLVRLVEALSVLRAQGRPLGLVIVGNDSGEGASIAAAVRHNRLDDHVRLLQGVRDEDLCAIYRGSALVVIPSTYEGFGIPVLEAMAASRPLVCSDLPVFRELTKSRGAYFPPLDTAAMAAAIAEVLDSPERQSALVGYGQQRVRDFAFASLAGELERLYHTLCR